jgi:pilus assembly protein Flp/PilA
MRALRAFLADCAGASAIEYAVIASGVALAIVVAVGITGTNLQNKYTEVLDKFSAGQ